MSIRFGPFALDFISRELRRGNERLHLTPRAFDVLALLAASRPKALSREQILDEVWEGIHVSEGALSVAVAEVRTALDDDPRVPKYIRTVHRFGYAFCAEVESEEDGPPTAGPYFRLIWGSRQIALRPGVNVLGRGKESEARIDDTTISRRHAIIRIEAGTAEIEDLDSKNGTFVRQERLRGTRALRDGDPIRLGRVAMVFRVFSQETPTESFRDEK